MLKAGTVLDVLRNDGYKDVLTVGYCGRQLAVIDRGYHVLCPAFYRQDDELNSLHIDTKEYSFDVVNVHSPSVVRMRPFLITPIYMCFVSGEENGDLLVFCSLEKNEYSMLKVTPKESEASLNEKMKNLYYTERMLHLATYRCLESPYLNNDNDLRQYGLWWIRDCVHLDPVLESNLKELKHKGYKKLIPNRGMVNENREADEYLFDKKDRMTWLFPLSGIEYDIDELLENKVIAILPEQWKGYQRFREEFCKRGGCV